MRRPEDMAGCISVYNIKESFGFQWNDCFVPVGVKLTAIQRAVLECAYVGCSSIWITAHGSIMPFLKECLGDFAIDPVYLWRKFDPHKNKKLHRRYIPIYYVPMHVQDVKRRDSTAWGIINSARYARKAMRILSKFMRPWHFYVAFPFGVYDPRQLRSLRKDIAKAERVVLTHNGRSVVDGEYLGFKFNFDDLMDFYHHVRRTEFGYRDSDLNYIKGVEHWTGRKFGVGDIYNIFKKDEAFEIPVEKYWNIETYHGFNRYWAECEKKPYLSAVLKSDRTFNSCNNYKLYGIPLKKRSEY